MKSGALVIGLVTAGLAANAIRLRRKLAQLDRLPMEAPTGSGAKEGWGARRRSYDLVSADGVEVPADVREAAGAYATDHGLDIVDLVPADMSVDQAMDLARFIDLDSYRRSPIALGRGAGHAILADAELLKRWGNEVRTGLEPGEMGEATLRLRQYADSADLVVAPLQGHAQAGRRAWLTAQSVTMRQSYALPTVLVGSAASYAAVVGCIALNPVLGLLPLAVYTAVPYIVFLRTAIRPHDLHRSALLRIVETPLGWWRTVRAPRDRWERRRAQQFAASRTWHEEQLKGGLHSLFEERRHACPWCGSQDLRPHVRIRDGVHLKPGRFTIERCADCGHVFLNPALNPAGLDFYYKDVYDGAGGTDMDNVLAGQRNTYLGRAQLVQEALVRQADPQEQAPLRWLDVGTGSAHFPRQAREVFPNAEFHGLDMGSSVLDAKRRGWIQEAFRGTFPELADRLAGQYDVVSMNHYLEHTLNPLAELDAVAKVLRPGGHVLIEVPDPECRYGRLLRSYWIAWLTPEHLNLVPLANLEQALRERGFEVTGRARRAARQGPDVPHAAAAFLNTLWRPTDRPWLPPKPKTVTFLRRTTVAALAVPVMLGAMAAELAELAVRPLLRDRSNAYRIVARKVPQ